MARRWITPSVGYVFRLSGEALLRVEICSSTRYKGGGGLGKPPRWWKSFWCVFDVTGMCVFFLFWSERATRYMRRGRHRLGKDGAMSNECLM